jgi:hypothetical protein
MYFNVGTAKMIGFPCFPMAVECGIRIRVHYDSAEHEYREILSWAPQMVTATFVEIKVELRAGSVVGRTAPVFDTPTRFDPFSLTTFELRNLRGDTRYLSLQIRKVITKLACASRCEF